MPTRYDSSRPRRHRRTRRRDLRRPQRRVRDRLHDVRGAQTVQSPTAICRARPGRATRAACYLVQRRHHRPIVSANSDLEGLPPAARCAFAGAGAEGTALLEIVHDIAPGAKLSFANADTDLAFNQAVNFLAASNDVVLDDLGFYGEPSDGTSMVSSNTANALNNRPIRFAPTSPRPATRPTSTTTAAYEDSRSRRHDDDGIASRPPAPVSADGDTTDVLGLGSQPYNLISLPQNGEVSIFLTWDDPFGGSANNYDLFLVQQSTGRVVARSTDVQSGQQDPVESLDYVNRGAQDRFAIVVQNVHDGARPKHLKCSRSRRRARRRGRGCSRRRGMSGTTTTRPRAASRRRATRGERRSSVVSVGADLFCLGGRPRPSRRAAPEESCLDIELDTSEFFSSRGPTLDGRPKPDIAAIDGVAVSGAGSFGTPFFGTSAAAPHVGGIAALRCKVRRVCSIARVQRSRPTPPAARSAICCLASDARRRRGQRPSGRDVQTRSPRSGRRCRYGKARARR